MQTTSQISAIHGWSDNPSPTLAFDEIFRDAQLTSASLGIVFASARYDLDKLGKAIEERFPCPVIGCTTAGEISSDGYREDGICAAVLYGVEARVAVMPDIHTFGEADAKELAETLGTSALSTKDHAVLITLFDGLCMREEWLCSQLYTASGGIPMVGGSAGDRLTFDRTSVYHDSQFHTGIGICALVRAQSGIRTFIEHHYEDTGELLVVTKAEPERRRILELNGIPAAEAYAAALGLKQDHVSKIDELLHPLMLNAGDRPYIRGVREIMSDGTMQLYCSIDEGVVLHLGKAKDTHAKLGLALEDICTGLTPQLTLMFDCVTRRLEAKHMESHGAFSAIASKYPAIGFSTYGEQYNGVHVNQTMTGVVFGDTA